MQFPQGLIDFLVYLAPSLLVFFTTWFLVRRFLQRESAIKAMELRTAQQKDLIPLRLQAYERLSIYLERISPQAMLLTQFEQGMDVRDFQQHLLAMIREEFEHNYAQQIYISPALWKVVRQAKEETARQIMRAASGADQQAPGYELSKHFFEIFPDPEAYPTQKALNILKAEVAQIL